MIWCASVRKPHLYKPVYNDSLEPQLWNLGKGSFRIVMLTFRETCALNVVTSVSPGGSKLKETRDGHSRQGDCSSRAVPRPWRVRLQTGPTCPKGLGLLGGPLGVLWGRAVTELSAVSGKGPPNAGVDHGAELSLLLCQHLGPAIRGASGASRLSLGHPRPSSGILSNSQRPLGSPLSVAVQAAGCRQKGSHTRPPFRAGASWSPQHGRHGGVGARWPSSQPGGAWRFPRGAALHKRTSFGSLALF